MTIRERGKEKSLRSKTSKYFLRSLSAASSSVLILVPITSKSIAGQEKQDKER
jgi:hypothetical protein